MTQTTTHEFEPEQTMAAVLAIHPGAQRALFRKYHIGGCSSCGFRPDETLAQICARNEQMPIDEVLAFLKSSQEEDARQMISSRELKARLEDPSLAAGTRLLDIRTREEFDAVSIPGARHFTQQAMNEVLMWPRDSGTIVIIDHRGERSLDAAAYFQGQGFANVLALAGGIDAFAAEAAPELPRYTLE